MDRPICQYGTVWRTETVARVDPDSTTYPRARRDSSGANAPGFGTEGSAPLVKYARHIDHRLKQLRL
jgi:hypothetical protein